MYSLCSISGSSCGARILLCLVKTRVNSAEVDSVVEISRKPVHAWLRALASGQRNSSAAVFWPVSRPGSVAGSFRDVSGERNSGLEV